MSLIRLRTLEKNLDNLFSEVSLLSEGDIYKAHLSRYLCVRTSGYLESVMRNLIANYCDGTSPQQIQSYILKKTKYITNLEYRKIVKILGEFSHEWMNDFENRINDQQRSSLNSVVSNRNNIAHGNSDSITYRDMKNYYLDIKEVAVLLKDIIKK